MVPRIFEVHFLTKSYRNALFSEMLKIEPYMSPMQNLILGIENPSLGPLFKHISFFKKFLSQNLDFWILDFYAIFWLDSEVAKYDFFPRAVTL